MDEAQQRLLVGAFLIIIAVGIANTVFHALVGYLTMSVISGFASLIALWAVWTIFLQS